MKALVVLVTCPTRVSARRIAEALIRRRLAACVNIMPGLTSVYEWQGKIERTRELLLVIKTAPGSFARVKRAVLGLHPYQVPEVIALPVVQGHQPYLTWVARGSRGS